MPREKDLKVCSGEVRITNKNKPRYTSAMRGGESMHTRFSRANDLRAEKAYRVTAFYDYPPLERSTVVEAENPQRAMARALLEGKVPALFSKDEFGWLVPVYWHPRLAGDE